jgi:propanol-preferring alcohol dehydrogenase
VIFSNWGTRAELAEVVDLARAGVIQIEVERVALDAVPAAYARLEAGDVRGRVVAVP